MKMIRKLAVATLFVFMLAFVAFSVMAQTNTGGTASPAPMIAVWNALIVAIVPAVIAGIKKVAPKVPSVVWPVIAPLLGVAVNWLGAKAGVLPQTGWALGALFGAAGVGLREIVDQVTSLSPSKSSPAPAPPAA